MSSLIVMHDSQLMLLEVAVEKLYMPWVDVFDAALMKKTVIMFRMLDDEWTTLMPNRRDYRTYRGSNHETEYFHGGRSVLFAVPEAMLGRKMSGVDLQLYVYRGISKYFELEPRRNFGFTLVRVDDLLNGIIKDLGERKELEGYFSRDLEREPISRSTRGTFSLLDEDLEITDARIELYVRISYLGKRIVTELHTPASLRKAFYAREEMDEHYRYQFRELNTMELESFCWGSRTIVPPLEPDKLLCDCKNLEEDEDAGTRTRTEAQAQSRTRTETQDQAQSRTRTETQDQAQSRPQAQTGTHTETQVQAQARAQAQTRTQAQAQAQAQTQAQSRTQTEAQAQAQAQAQSRTQSETQARTQTQAERQRERKRDERKRVELALTAKLARTQELLALMKETRKNRPDVVPLGDGPKKVCPPPAAVAVCPAVCPPVCVYTLPSACPNPCQPTTTTTTATTICCFPASC